MPSRREILDMLLETLADGRISRSEQRALSLVLEEAAPDARTRRALMADLFDAARKQTRDPRDHRLLEWLEEALRVVLPEEPMQEVPRTRAYFGPEDPMVETVERFIRKSRKKLDVAVFTITHNRLCRALEDAHRGGVRVRILSDDDKAYDPGSDIHQLISRGVPVRLDHSSAHFHHKFAVRDRDTVWVGSFNWTRGADESNHENFLISHEAGLVGSYQQAFDRMWRELGGTKTG